VANLGEMWRSNVTYRENMALRCGCSISAAEKLDSSAVGAAQLAHAADESILCREGWRRRGIFSNKKHLKNVGPIRHNEPPHANSPGVATALSHAACASKSTTLTTTTTTTTTTRDRGDLYGPMEWAQLLSKVYLADTSADTLDSQTFSSGGKLHTTFNIRCHA